VFGCSGRSRGARPQRNSIRARRPCGAHLRPLLWLGGEVDGVLANYVVFSEERVVRVPAHLSWAEATCLPCAGLTAWNALAYGGSLVAGSTVLIQGNFFFFFFFAAFSFSLADTIHPSKIDYWCLI
jgi:threonine dehydrogenase-like Zn-dependent dehydrogenase